MAEDGKIYIGTILLEVNRWTAGKEPSYLVSEWVERFAEAGFDGMELWQFHAPPDDELPVEGCVVADRVRYHSIVRRSPSAKSIATS